MAFRALRAVFGRRPAVGVLLLAAAVALGAALASRDAGDPVPLLRAGPTAETANWLGPVGAFAAEILLQLFGLVAFAAPLALLDAGRRRLRGMRDPDRHAGAIRLVIGTSLAIGLAGLGALAYETFGGAASFNWGGLFGEMLASALATLLKPLGAALVLTALVVISALSLRPPKEERDGAPATKPKSKPSGLTRLFRRRRQKAAPDSGRLLPRRVVARIGTSKPSTAQAEESAKRPPAARTPRRKAASPPPTRKDPPGAARDAKWAMPPLKLFTRRASQPGPGRAVLKQRQRALEEACREHGVRGDVVNIQPGPVVTTFEFRLGEGETLNKLKNRHEEICMALKAPAIRVERMRGRGVVGIEVPNEKPALVGLREILESNDFRRSRAALPVAVGRSVDGEPLVADLAAMPHLLIAGATGAGKSVQINTLLCSLLVNWSPDELRLILIDPKRVELRPYRDLPHLLTPLILEPDRAKVVLQRACSELDRRTRLLEEHGVRNIAGYNRRVAALRSRPRGGADGAGEDLPQPMARLVVVVDELADLLIHARAEVSEALHRLLALGRAEGIHLVLATQRPSVDIISGSLKANLPTRIAFRVATSVDSRTILDRGGADELLGRGDMLMMRPGADLPRAQGAFVAEDEVERLADHWKALGEPEFDEQLLVEEDPAAAALIVGSRGSGPLSTDQRRADAMLPQARSLVLRERKASTSMLQTELGLGYQRARRIVAELERQGIVGPQRGARPREVLAEAAP